MLPFPTIYKHTVILLMAWTAFSQTLWSETKAIGINVPEGYDEITYDSSRVNRHDIDHWLTLSPVISQNNFYLVPESTLGCDSDDPSYAGCGREQIWLKRNNAKRSQERIWERLEHLKITQFPSEFRLIVLYFRSVQSLGLWYNQQEIDYFESRNIENLERAYAPLGIDPTFSCADTLKQIRISMDPLTAWKLVVHDWQNCMRREATKAIGEYPQQLWDKALEVHGMRERLVVQEN